MDHWSAVKTDLGRFISLNVGYFFDQCKVTFKKLQDVGKLSI